MVGTIFWLMNKNAGGTNVPTKGTIQGFSGGGMIEVQGTGNTVEGTLKMKDASGKQVGKTYSAHQWDICLG